MLVPLDRRLSQHIFAGGAGGLGHRGNALGAGLCHRIEGGYRIATSFAGLTPYVALQAQSLRTPTYNEIDLSGGGFGLAYAARSATDTRSELGARFDRAMLVAPDTALTLRGGLAWAHDWVSDPVLTAVFQTLPGASLIVSGATPAKNTALVSAGADLHLARGITLSAKSDGEFAGRAQTYAATGNPLQLVMQILRPVPNFPTAH